jgi:hypothetical protein
LGGWRTPADSIANMKINANAQRMQELFLQIDVDFCSERIIYQL